MSSDRIAEIREGFQRQRALIENGDLDDAVALWTFGEWFKAISDTLAELDTARAEVERLKLACAKANEEVCQTLGKALGYPWFKNDQRNFPGATEADGVCVGEHVAETLAVEAARCIAQAEANAVRREREAFRLGAWWGTQRSLGLSIVMAEVGRRYPLPAGEEPK